MRLASAFKLAIVFGRGVAVRGLFGEGIYLIEIFFTQINSGLDGRRVREDGDESCKVCHLR